MTKMPKPGDHVSWRTPQGQTEGMVERTVTRTTHIKGHVAHASKDEPQLLVRSDKSGKTAVHKPAALKTS